MTKEKRRLSVTASTTGSREHDGGASTPLNLRKRKDHAQRAGERPASGATQARPSLLGQGVIIPRLHFSGRSSEAEYRIATEAGGSSPPVYTEKRATPQGVRPCGVKGYRFWRRSKSNANTTKESRQI